MTLKENIYSVRLKRDSQTRFKAIVFRLAWLSAANALLYIALFITTGEKFTLVRMLSYGSPWLAGTLLFMAIPAVLCRKLLLTTIFLFSALTLIFPHLYIFSSSQIVAATGQSFKAMTYSKMGRNHNIEAVARVVLSEKPDVLFMQEIDKRETENLIQLLQNIYDGAPVFYLVDEQTGLILSRFKLISRKKKDDFSQAAEIEFPENSISVWNVHLQKSFGNTDLQYKMTDQLAGQIATAASPVIVAGDFNATVVNYPYKKIKQQLENAFENAGSGFGFTFPSAARRIGVFTPFMRIDHIFYSSQFNIHKSYVVEQSGESDHFPVVAILSFKKDEDAESRERIK